MFVIVRAATLIIVDPATQCLQNRIPALSGLYDDPKGLTQSPANCNNTAQPKNEKTDKNLNTLQVGP